MTSISLGDTAKDSITGLKGVVVAETQWLHGCRRLTLQPTGLKDGKPMDGITFDEPQLLLVARATIKAGRRDTGGPRPEPMRR
jgi:hypothetical protein